MQNDVYRLKNADFDLHFICLIRPWKHMIQGEKIWLGVKFDPCYKSVMCRIVVEKKSHLNRQNIRIIISVVCWKSWKTRCVMLIQQTVTDSDVVSKQVLADIRRRRSQTNLTELYALYQCLHFITGCTLLFTKFPNLVNTFCIVKSNNRSLKKKIERFNICGWTSR